MVSLKLISFRIRQTGVPILTLQMLVGLLSHYKPVSSSKRPEHFALHVVNLNLACRY